MRRRNPEDYLFPGGTLIAYHGGHLLVGGKFDLSYVGRGEGSSFPGIFFTNSKDNAEGYAKLAPLGENYVYTVRLDARGFYDGSVSQPQRLKDRLAQLVKDIGADKLPTQGHTNRYGYGYIGAVIQKLGPVEGPKALIDIGVTGQVRYWGRATKVGNISSDDLFEVAVLDPSVITILSVEKVSVPYSLHGQRKSEMHVFPYDPLFDEGPPPLSPMAQALHGMVTQIEALGFRVPAHAKASPEGFVAWAETVNVPPGKRAEDVPEYLRLLKEAEAYFEAYIEGDDTYSTYSRLMDQAKAIALREGIYEKRYIEEALRIRREMIASLIRRKEPREIPVFRNPRKRAPAPRTRRKNPMVAGFSRTRAYDPDARIDNDAFQYLVEREIPALARHHWGGGSYAQVWRVPNSKLVFKATRDESEIAAQARLMRKGLSHPSIVDGYCVAESAFHDGLWFIATRFVDFNSIPSDYWVWLRDNWEYLQDAAENADVDNYPYDGNVRGRAQQSRFQRWTDHLFDALRLLALEGIRWLDVSKDNLVLDPTTDLPVILDLGHSEVDGEPEEVPTMTPMEAYRCALRVAGRKTNPYRSRGVRSTRTLRR
jgi:hypothetical protein